MKKYQWLWIVLAVVVVILIIAGIFLWAESPTRIMKSAVKDIEAHQVQKVMDKVDKNITDSKKNEIERTLKRLADAESISTKITKDEAWRQQDDTVKPTKRYIASNYRAEVEMTLDGELTKVTFRLGRQGATNEFKFFSFLFKPWVITNVKVGK